MPPVYVKACKRERWYLNLQSKSGAAGYPKRVPFRCRSWRHEGKCREWCGACDYKRVAEAMQTHGPWSFLVLTYPAISERHNYALFKAAVVHWDRLRKRLLIPFDDMKYIQTWEVTRKGVPHVNVAISSQKLYDLVTASGRWVADDRRKLGVRWAWHDLESSWKTTWLESAQVECGFGPVSTLEPCTDKERMAGYLLKLARELTGSGRKSQIPVDAPLHFRRLRASRKTLPPRVKDPDITGTLEFSIHPDQAAGVHAAFAERGVRGAIANLPALHPSYSPISFGE